MIKTLSKKSRDNVPLKADSNKNWRGLGRWRTIWSGLSQRPPSPTWSSPRVVYHGTTLATLFLSRATIRPSSGLGAALSSGMRPSGRGHPSPSALLGSSLLLQDAAFSRYIREIFWDSHSPFIHWRHNCLRGYGSRMTCSRSRSWSLDLPNHSGSGSDSKQNLGRK